MGFSRLAKITFLHFEARADNYVMGRMYLWNDTLITDAAGARTIIATLIVQTNTRICQ